MRTYKKLGVLALSVLALGAIGAGNASAAQFTASAAGSLTGSATAAQVFTTNWVTIKCVAAETSGAIGSTSATELHVTVLYKECRLGQFPELLHVSPATYVFTANGEAHLKSPVTFTFTLGLCQLTIPAQSIKTFGFATSGSKLKVTPTVSTLKVTATGGGCGASTSFGSYTGPSEIERVGGGSVSFDP
ncbi:MAG TPA: hypothetical protein VJU14_03835 [Solirubrobacterales bacterium]|nr:hypothetical protein [Solirubrobacterales bacterium]